MFSVKVFAVASLLSAAFAAPVVPSTQHNDPRPSIAQFTTLAANSRSPIHNRTLNANGFDFWIGKPTTNFCPPNVTATTGCPLGNTTVMEVNQNGTCNMDVKVPGGQRVYVAETGALKYTTAWTDGEIPAGGDGDGFILTPQPKAPYDAFTYDRVGKASTWLACPYGPDVWQIFVNLSDITNDDVPGDVGGCLAFDGLATRYLTREPAAYQYV